MVLLAQLTSRGCSRVQNPLGAKASCLGTPRLGLQEKEAKFSQCSCPSRITALSPPTAVTPEACLAAAPWPGRS